MSVPVKRCPATYEEHKEVVDAHIAEALPPILEKLEFGSNELILDHGSATGGNTLKYLAPIAEKTNSQIYALDNCEAMTTFAAENNPHATITYVHGSLTSDPSPFKGLKFNKIFSLYTLQFVDDYRRELKELYDALESGGQLFIITKLHARFFELFEKLYEHENFGDNAKDHLVIPKWIDESDDENSEVLKKAILETGFEVQEYNVEDRECSFEHPGVAANLLFAMNGFVGHLADEHHADLKALYHKFFHETETRDHKPGEKSDKYTGHYDSLCALLKKP